MSTGPLNTFFDFDIFPPYWATHTTSLLFMAKSSTREQGWSAHILLPFRIFQHHGLLPPVTQDFKQPLMSYMARKQAKMKYKFGEKLRTIRERKNLTLKDVARKVGVSESLISQIERNKVSPSTDTLLFIADVLDIDYEYLFSDYRQKRKVAIVKRSERDRISRNKMTIQQLSVATTGTTDPAIEAFLLQIETGGEKGDREYGHTGWEFGVILKGQAQLIYGNEVYNLDEGDSISFPSDIPHLFQNNGPDLLEAIWVVAPPRGTFST